MQYFVYRPEGRSLLSTELESGWYSLLSAYCLLIVIVDNFKKTNKFKTNVLEAINKLKL